MAAKDFGGFDQLLEIEDEVGEFVLDQDDPRSFQPGGTVRHAERQPRDRLRLNREAAGFQRETLVVGIEAERFLGPIGVVDAHKAFAAEIEVEPRTLERPFRRHLDLADVEA